MKVSYRTVFFHPDPSLEWRIPVAVLVARQQGVQVGLASQVPSVACLGSRGRQALLRFGLGHLEAVGDVGFDRLPPSLGPHFSAGEAQALGVDVEDPLAWAVQNLLPHRPDGLSVKRSRGEQRSTQGRRFFEQRGVARHVRKSFSPKKYLPDAEAFRPFGRLHPVSHWVWGDRRLLLMEPLVPERRDVEHDLDSVVNLFFSYADLVSIIGSKGVESQRIAYVLPGGEKRARRELRSGATAAADRVIDLASPKLAAEFAEEIERIGKSGEEQIEMVLA